MKIYHYHPETGVYLGVGIADESPLEPGVFLIPAFATDVEPPACGANQTVKFISEVWVLEDIPQPELPPEPTVEEIRVARLSRLNAEYISGKAILRDAYVTADMRQDADVKAEIVADLAVLDAGYTDKLAMINTGQDPWEVV